MSGVQNRGKVPPTLAQRPKMYMAHLPGLCGAVGQRGYSNVELMQKYSLGIKNKSPPSIRQKYPFEAIVIFEKKKSPPYNDPTPPIRDFGDLIAYWQSHTEGGW